MMQTAYTFPKFTRARHCGASFLTHLALVLLGLAAQTPLSAQTAAPVSVMSHGAKGDGVSDDTAAIEAAVLEATKGNGVVFFPPGEYLISRTIYLQSNMTFRGAQGATLKRPPAVTRKLIQPLKKGETAAFVDDIKGFQVNQGFALVDGSATGDNGMTGKIVAIDPGEKKLTVEISGNFGEQDAFAGDGTSVMSTAFPILATKSGQGATSNVVIEGLTFDCQSQADEPKAYFLAPISLGAPTDTGDQSNVTVRHNIILNSSSVGISVQVSENATIESNQIFRCALAGIHVGATTGNVTIRNNIIEDGEGMAIFLGKAGTIVTNNFIKNSTAGIVGTGEHGSNSVISFNVFEGLVTGIDLRTNATGHTVITDNLFHKGKGTDILLDAWNFCVIANNMFADGMVSGLSLQGTKHASVVNNQFFNYTGDFCIRVTGSASDPKTLTELSRIAGNIVVGGRQASMSLENARRVIVSENQFLPYEGGMALKIAETASEIQLTDNIVEGEVLNASTPKD